MKKTSLTLGLLAASLLSGSAMAQVYVSGDVGFSHINIDCQAGLSCDQSDTAFKLTGGYNLGNNFSAELGYIDFGKAKITGLGQSGEIKVSGFTFGGAYALPIAKDVDLNFRLGLARLKAKGGGAISGSENKTAPYFGFGADYALNKNMKIEAGFDFGRARFDGENGNVRAFTVGARYAF